MCLVSMKSSTAKKMGYVGLPFRCWWETATATLVKKCNISASAMFVGHHVFEHELCLKCFVYLLGFQSGDMACGTVRWASLSHFIATFSVCRVKGAADVVCVSIIGSDGGPGVTEWILPINELPSQDTVDPKIRREYCRQFWSLLPLINTNSVNKRRAVSVTHFNVFCGTFSVHRWLQARSVC